MIIFATTAAKTMPPTTGVTRLGVPPKASQPHIGANGEFSEPISAVSITGSAFAPSMNSTEPSARLTIPNSANVGGIASNGGPKAATPQNGRAMEAVKIAEFLRKT